jgi:hypothetical protein
MTNEATHRCSECGHEANDDETATSTPRGGSCSFGPNKGHIHIFYRIDWQESQHRAPGAR